MGRGGGGGGGPGGLKVLWGVSVTAEEGVREGDRMIWGKGEGGRAGEVEDVGGGVGGWVQPVVVTQNLIDTMGFTLEKVAGLPGSMQKE